RQGTRRTGAEVRIGGQGVRRLLLPPLLVGLEPSRHGIPPLGQWRDSLYQRTLTEAYLDTNDLVFALPRTPIGRSQGSPLQRRMHTTENCYRRRGRDTKSSLST